jgi:tyrosinase
MVERFTSKPIELPPAGHSFQRADLIFYGLDHSGDSFEGRVFLDARGVSRDADAGHRAYVGSFFILGHGGCFGDVGHCDIPAERDPFDLRPAHQLEPALRILTVTDAVRRLLERGVDAAKVTVVAHTAGRAPNDVLAFETVRLASYA